MEFKQLIKERYSCRQFSDRVVEDNLIEQIIDAADTAPTAVNKQPVKIFWMKTTKAKEDIIRTTKFTFGAKDFLVVGYRQDEGWVRSYDGHTFAETDAAIVATHIMLQIANLGLATTWVGHFDASLLQSIYPSMKDYTLTAIFPIGYPAVNAEPSPSHFKRKEREEILEIL